MDVELRSAEDDLLDPECVRQAVEENKKFLIASLMFDDIKHRLFSASVITLKQMDTINNIHGELAKVTELMDIFLKKDNYKLTNDYTALLDILTEVGKISLSQRLIDSYTIAANAGRMQKTGECSITRSTIGPSASHMESRKIIVMLKTENISSMSRNCKNTLALLFRVLQNIDKSNISSVPMYIEKKYILHFRMVHKKPLRMVFESSKESKEILLYRHMRSGKLERDIIKRLKCAPELDQVWPNCKISVEFDMASLQVLEQAKISQTEDDWTTNVVPENRCYKSGCRAECIERDYCPDPRPTLTSAEKSRLISAVYADITDSTQINNTKKYKKTGSDLLKSFQVYAQQIEFSSIRDERGCSVLHQCALHNRMDVLSAIFDSGQLARLYNTQVSGDRNNYRGKTALDIAMKLKHISLQEELLHLKEVEGSLTFAHKYARAGDDKRLHALIKRHPELINVKASNGLMPLYFSITSGNRRCVKMLLNAGADVNALSDKGDTMLIRAVSLGHGHLLECLVEEYNADPDVVGAQRKTALHHAIDRKDKGMVSDLIDMDAHVSESVLCQAAVAGEIDIMKTLEESTDCDMNYVTTKGKSLLFLAVENNNEAMCQYLLEHGAQLDVRDKRGRTLCHAAVDGGNPQIFDVILSYVKDKKLLEKMLNQQDFYIGSERCFLVRGRDHGNLAFHYVEVDRLYIHRFREITRNGGSLDVAEYGTVFLSGWGAVPPPEYVKQIDEKYGVSNITAETPLDLTPLQLAILKDRPDCALKLLEYKCKCDINDCFGNSSLHLASMRGQLQVVKELVRQGADTNAVNDQGKTAKDAAEFNQHVHVINFLSAESFLEQQNSHLRRLRADLATLVSALGEQQLDEERRQGNNVQQYTVGKLRDMIGSINQTFYDMGTSPVMEESSQ